MPLPLELMRQLQTQARGDAWRSIFEHAWNICAAPLEPDKAVSDVSKRDGELAAVDLFLATAGWDLWTSYESVAPRTASVLESWWHAHPPGRAVLVLDALSLREVPWLLQGAKLRGYTIHQARATGAELPADTTPFAAALGFSSRSSLQNHGGIAKGRLAPTATESTNLPWEDCASQIHPAQDWFFWHHWPDERLHDLSGPGQALAALTKEAGERLSAEGFWALIQALTTGRRLVITADHGYAASGQFPDTADQAQAQALKERFASGRWSKVSPDETISPGPWIPPIELVLETAHEHAAFALGRRKWKSQGGYPTLTHGGLSVLEVAVPFIELSRTGGA